jgi:hypothetical protein
MQATRRCYNISSKNVPIGTTSISTSALCPPDAIDRLKTRGIEAELDSPDAYVDLKGNRHLPFDVALDIARRFCEAEPSTILVNFETPSSGIDRKTRGVVRITWSGS